MTKILIVEDNEMNLDMLSRRLRRRGYEICAAGDGAEGIEVAQREDPELILMDISLGDQMDGWEVTQRLKSNAATAEIPVIALTAHALASDREKSLAVGCVDFDTKPVDFARLLEKINACLDGAESPEVVRDSLATAGFTDIAVDSPPEGARGGETYSGLIRARRPGGPPAG